MWPFKKKTPVADPFNGNSELVKVTRRLAVPPIPTKRVAPKKTSYFAKLWFRMKVAAAVVFIGIPAIVIGSGLIVGRMKATKLRQETERYLATRTLQPGWIADALHPENVAPDPTPVQAFVTYPSDAPRRIVSPPSSAPIVKHDPPKKAEVIPSFKLGKNGKESAEEKAWEAKHGKEIVHHKDGSATVRDQPKKKK